MGFARMNRSAWESEQQCTKGTCIVGNGISKVLHVPPLGKNRWSKFGPTES